MSGKSTKDPKPLQLTLLDMIGGDPEGGGHKKPTSTKDTVPAEAPSLPKNPTKRDPVSPQVDTPPSPKKPRSTGRPIPPSKKGIQVPAPQPEPRVYSVSALIQELNRDLRERFKNIWVEGELGRVSFHRNIYYLSLKEADALLDCVIMTWTFKPPFPLKEGLRVRARGSLDVYPQRGKLSLHIQYMEPLGEGALALAFEQLKKRLHAEGLFAQIHKKPIPPFPRTVGVVTSTTSAAFRDILKVSGQRMGTRIIAAHTTVQGNQAPASLVASIRALVAYGGLDVLIVARGGGSAEDLAGFNDEGVVRELFSCPIPVVTGVGHQIDYTLVDFVADKRAATPTEAAEMVFPDKKRTALQLAELTGRMHKAVEYEIGMAGGLLQRLGRKIVDPHSYLSRKGRELDGLAMVLERVTLQQLEWSKRRLDSFSQQLHPAHLSAEVNQGSSRLGSLKERLLSGIQEYLHHGAREFSALEATLRALDPMAVLQRGYAVVSTPSGEVLRDAQEVSQGDPLKVRLKSGGLTVRVEERDV